MTPSLKRSRGVEDSDNSLAASLKKSTGSPSREYLAELSLQHEHYNKELVTRLEADERRRGKTHQDALIAAKAEHTRIRRAAQRAQEWNLLQVEQAKQQQEDDEAREIERQRTKQLQQEIADRRRRAEKAHQLEQLRKQAELEQKQHDEEAKRRADRELEEAHKAEENRRLKELQAQQSTAQASKPSDDRADDTNTKVNRATTRVSDREETSSLLSTTQATIEKEHDQYLELHKWLKTMRANVETEVKKDPRMKPLLGDWRREIKKTVGQLTVDKKAIVTPRKKILDIMKRARAYETFKIDSRNCFAKGAPPELDEKGAQIPGLLIYYLNIFSKAVINQWASEGGAKIEAADPPGFVASYIFSIDDTKVQGHSFIDILLAKLHVVCPVPFGIYGSEKSDAGRARLGWEREMDGKTSRKTRWTAEQRHHDRMRGLGAGFAAISLRDFSRAPMPNPYPPVNYWQAMARIVNIPSRDITTSHLIVLKAMIETSVGAFAKFYKKAARVALRTALIDFPTRAPDGPAKVGLTTLPEILSKNHGINL